VRRGSPDVYVGDLTASAGKLENVKRLTYDSQADLPHGWTPDSSAFIFESDRSGVFQIYRQALTVHDPDIIAPTNTTEVFPQISPDGKWILYENNGGPFPSEPYKLFRVPAAGGAPVEFPAAPLASIVARIPARHAS
jgi:Tol biopolymer transport system component